MPNGGLRLEENGIRIQGTDDPVYSMDSLPWWMLVLAGSRLVVEWPRELTFLSLTSSE